MRKEIVSALNAARASRTVANLSVGDLDHREWQHAQPIPITIYWSGETAPPERHAEARILWSDVGLFVRFTCRQHEPLVVTALPQRSSKTLGLWERDVCEIFVSPGMEDPTHYFEFEVAPTGEWLDLVISHTDRGRETDWGFRSGMTVAAQSMENCVRMALCVPWDAFGHAPTANKDIWRANLFRCVGEGESRGYLAWRPLGTDVPNFHTPEAFGSLFFCE